MCTRKLSGLIILCCLTGVAASAQNTTPLAQKLPPQTLDKRPLAYFGFDQKGPMLRANLIQRPQTLQTQGTRYTPDGLDQGALEFNGSSGQVTIPITTASNLTLSAWFMPAGYSQTDVFKAYTVQSRQHTLAISLDLQGNVTIQQTTPSSQASSSLNMGLVLPANQWLHLALVATPQTLVVYLNGQSMGNFTMPVLLGNSRLLIADRTFKGKIDELALFEQTLTAQDIEAIYTMHKPLLAPASLQIPQIPQDMSWEAKAAHTYFILTQAINSGNWSQAATQTGTLSDLVFTYIKDHKTDLNEPTQGLIQANMTKASSLLKSFKEAVEQARYHDASDLFDTLDECWETLETQLNLPSPQMHNTNTPLTHPGLTRSTQFSQTWSSGTMSGTGLSGGSVSLGETGSGGMTGGGFSMSSSSGAGPNSQTTRQFRFNSSGMPDHGFMGQSQGQMTPQMTLFRIQMQVQRIQMALKIVKMSFQNSDWQTAQRHHLQLQQLVTQIEAPKDLLQQPDKPTRRRTLNLDALPPAQQSALKTQVQAAHHPLSLLNTAIEKQDIEAANQSIQSLEKVIESLGNMTNSLTPPLPTTPPSPPTH